MGIMNIVTLLGGLSLFLFAMKIMGDALEQAAGGKMKKLLGMVTHNRFLSMLAGILITALVQSSSATTVMVVGFVNANLISLTQAAGIIMGANIGTTVTSLLLSIKLNFGAIFACIGLLMKLLPKKWKAPRQIGGIVMGLGILFIGMEMMSSAMEPLRTWPGFRDMIAAIGNPLAGVLVGALITAVLQSSAAAIGILQVMAGEGLIPLQTAIFILFGMNIGTCVTALISVTESGLNARRAAAVHLLFNMIGTAVFVALACILPIADWVAMLAPGQFRLQVAVIHIVFNVGTTLLLLPLASQLEKLACMIVRGKEEETVGEQKKMLYFDEHMLKTPPIAVSQLFREVNRMGAIARGNLADAVACFEEWDQEKLDRVNTNEDVLDYLNENITHRLVELNAMELDDEDKRLVGSLFHVVNDMERIGDHSVNIVELAQNRLEHEIKFSHKAINELDELSRLVADQLDEALDILLNQANDVERIDAVEHTETEIDERTEALRDHHIQRLKERKCSARNGLLYMDMLTNLERIADHAENIATSVDNTTPVNEW